MPQAHASPTAPGTDEPAAQPAAQGAFLRRPCAPAAAAAPAVPAAGRASGTEQQVVRILHDLHAMLGERKHTLRAMRATQVRTLRRLILVAAQREAGGLEHCLRVGALAALLAEALGETPEACDRLFDAATVHDLGNFFVPAAILRKRESLNEEEWRRVRDHTIRGARMLDARNSPLEALAAEVALNHHEKWDGSGYPAGRKATNIPLAARIVAVADFVDSLGLASAYRDALPEDEIFTLLDLAGGAQFDPEVVSAMHALRPCLARVRALAARCALTAATRPDYPPWWREAR